MAGPAELFFFVFSFFFCLFSILRFFSFYLSVDFLFFLDCHLFFNDEPVVIVLQINIFYCKFFFSLPFLFYF